MRAGFAVVSVGRHALISLAEGLLIGAIVIGIAFGLSLAIGGSPLGGDPALAAKGGRGAITVPDGVFGGLTTATVNPGGSGAMAYANCFQNGTLVYAEYVLVDSTNHATFKLGPTPLWSGGAASCTAEEGVFGNNGRWRTLASTTFEVSG